MQRVPAAARRMTEPAAVKAKRPRKSAAPKKRTVTAGRKSKGTAKKGKAKRRVRAKTSEGNNDDDGDDDNRVPEGAGPIFVRPADGKPIHPALEEQLKKPFLSSIYVDARTQSLRFPRPGGLPPAIMDGLHRRMLYRFFRGIELDNAYTKKAWPKRLRSSQQEGTRADNALAECIRTGQPPPPANHKGASEYASAVWAYWKEHHHRPVLAQLPVVIIHALTATAGDYFTVHRCPFTQRETLCLWELKTGYPKKYKEEEEQPTTMTIPMPGGETVPLTSVNRYYLQVLLTQMAYERELGLVVNGTVRVINVYKEREDMPKGATRPTYSCKVKVIGPEHLTPPRWPERVLKDQLYAGIRKQ
jgi:hypothetical protein